MTGSFFPVATYATGHREWLESEVWAAVLDNYFNRQASHILLMPQLLTPCGIRFGVAQAYDEALAAIFAQTESARNALEEVRRIGLVRLASAELVQCLGR